jgi:prevent-host-death family protein
VTNANATARSGTVVSLSEEVGYNDGEWSGMKTIATTEAEAPLGAIVDAAQREPIMIRKDDQDVAVVLSVADYERLRTGNAQAFLELRNKVAAEAAANGLTKEHLADLLTRNET